MLFEFLLYLISIRDIYRVIYYSSIRISLFYEFPNFDYFFILAIFDTVKQITIRFAEFNPSEIKLVGVYKFRSCLNLCP